MKVSDQIHSQALEISSRYKRAEVEFIEILQKVEKHRVFLARGHSSLFQYVTQELKISENVAYGLIHVSRKAREFPELGVELGLGRITLSNARRIAPVLTKENTREWL